MKLLLDANLSWRLTKPLANHFPAVAHVLDFFPHHAADRLIWELAKKEEYVIVTNDEDFVSLLSIKGWPPKVVLLKTGNQSNQYLCSLLVDRKKELQLFVDNDQLGMLVVQ